MDLHLTTPRLAVVGLVSVALGAATLMPAASSTPRATAQESAATAAKASTTAPDLLTAVAGTRYRGTHDGFEGEHLRVRVDGSALSDAAPGARVSVPLSGGAADVRIDRVERDGDDTVWSGSLPGQEISSFSMVEVDGVYRGSLVSLLGTYSLVRAADGAYWWSRVQQPQRTLGDDGIVNARGDRLAAAAARREAAAPAAAEQLAGRKKRKAKVTVLFAYTKQAKADAGGRAAMKATAKAIIAQTNESFRNSGVKAKVKYKGLVKAKGKNSGNNFTDLKRVTRPRDRQFDNVYKVRKRKNADLVHLITRGRPNSNSCGVAWLPAKVRRTHPSIGFSTSFYECLPYLTATHEIGHNLGAGHDKYPGVESSTKIPYAYGYANPAAGFVTVMAYPNACYDAGVNCVRIPWFSTPKAAVNGIPVGAGKRTNNAKAITKVAPRVARYQR